MQSRGDYSNGFHELEPVEEKRVPGFSSFGRAKRRSSRGGAPDPRDGLANGVRVSDQLGEQKPLETQKSPPPPCTDFDVAYFHSYAHVGIHEEMIKDRARTETYKEAIMQHQSLIQGKVVVDVGCGTGILSIFCAQAGAKRVYAVDASDIAVQAKEVVKANGLSDKVIVLHGRVEDVEIDEEVDVIISEWMGYMLLYESMLGSVITARDRWLKPGGLILPSHATLYMAPVSHPERYSHSIDFWRNVYGIDMSAMMQLAKQCAFEEPSVESISGENVLTWPEVVKHIDCQRVKIQELDSVTARYKFKSMMRAPMHGFGFWFDVEFSEPASSPAKTTSATSVASGSSSMSPSREGNHKKRSNPSDALVLSTSPEAPPTHWQQKNEKDSEKKAIHVIFSPENIRSSGDDDSSSDDDDSSSNDDNSSSGGVLICTVKWCFS
ncbi:hypothetical protein F2Q70_00010198 [Brassica cretica]|uniref:Protein arginine N-methyltransferase domain-containing protein n=1 Tax=Brassica cretica TaxID=69181 RepID=A0A8S9LYF0_BRACR|nr:hypothetical protein F2Q70_00010198 [Brassica cretica]